MEVPGNSEEPTPQANQPSAADTRRLNPASSRTSGQGAPEAGNQPVNVNIAFSGPAPTVEVTGGVAPELAGDNAPAAVAVGSPSENGAPLGGDTPVTSLEAATLASLDFAKLIGGPLQAAIEAQANAAKATVDFLQAVAWSQPADPKQPATLNTASFNYKRYITDPKSNTSTPVDSTLTVPIISLVPIPFIRIQQMTIDLDVKLNTITQSDNVNTNVVNTNVSGGGWWGIKFDVSVTNTNVNTQKHDTNNTYSMHVSVVAVQDAMPAGMARMLDIFNNVITEQATNPVPAK